MTNVFENLPVCLCVRRPSIYKRAMMSDINWIGLCSVLRPHQHSIGYTGDGFYRSKDPTNSIKVLKEEMSDIKPWFQVRL